MKRTRFHKSCVCAAMRIAFCHHTSLTMNGTVFHLARQSQTQGRHWENQRISSAALPHQMTCSLRDKEWAKPPKASCSPAIMHRIRPGCWLQIRCLHAPRRLQIEHGRGCKAVAYLAGIYLLCYLSWSSPWPKLTLSEGSFGDIIWISCEKESTAMGSVLLQGTSSTPWHKT